MDDLMNIPYKVYGLIDPRDHKVFYVGMSYIVKSRVKSHNTDKNGSAYERCQEIIRDGYIPTYCLFGIFDDAQHASFLEDALITTLPSLVNRTNKQEHRQFWRRFLSKMETAADLENTYYLRKAEGKLP